MGRPRRKAISYRDGQVLDMWATGFTGPEIAERYGITPSGVASIISDARKMGDPRAIIHNRRIYCERGLEQGRDIIKQARGNIIRLRARQRRTAQHIAGIEEMQAILAASDVPVTRCPPGWHAGHVPECLRV